MTVEEKFYDFLQKMDERWDDKKLSSIFNKNTFVEIEYGEKSTSIEHLVDEGYLNFIGLDIWDSDIFKYKLELTDKAVSYAKNLNIA